VRRSFSIVGAVPWLLVSMSALSQQEMQDTLAWTGSADFGFLSTSGNTDTETIRFTFDYGKDGERWRHALHVDAYNNASDNERTAERYLGYWQSNLKFDESHSIFFRGQYDEDKFSNYSAQGVFSIGYGNRLVDTHLHVLDIEIGPGYRRSKLADTGDYENEGILRLAGNYKWTISDNSAFGQLLSVEGGTFNTVVRSSTSLMVGFYKALSLSLSYDVVWTRDVSPDIANTDKQTSVGVVYTW
jgi:putative salt-induced outer membrane protein